MLFRTLHYTSNLNFAAQVDVFIYVGLF